MGSPEVVLRLDMPNRATRSPVMGSPVMGSPDTVVRRLDTRSRATRSPDTVVRPDTHSRATAGSMAGSHGISTGGTTRGGRR